MSFYKIPFTSLNVIRMQNIALIKIQEIFIFSVNNVPGNNFILQPLIYQIKLENIMFYHVPPQSVSGCMVYQSLRKDLCGIKTRWFEI